MEPPAGFRLVENRPGVALYRKDYQNGSPDYVQVADLSAGAAVDLLYGKPQGNDGKKSRGIFDGANPAFGYRTIHGYWQQYAQSQPEAFCVTNGQFFFMPENPTPLALPLKVDGTLVAEGFGFPQYPEKQLMLALWPDRADILPLTHENLYGTTAPDVIGGLTEEANKKPKNAVGRTFVGIADGNGDGSFESVAILTTGTATQKEAARTLYSFGASKVMMLDGGGSTQLVCGGRAFIDTERALPQAIGVASAGGGEQGSRGAGVQGGEETVLAEGVMPTPEGAVVAGAMPVVGGEEGNRGEGDTDSGGENNRSDEHGSSSEGVVPTPDASVVAGAMPVEAGEEGNRGVGGLGANDAAVAAEEAGGVPGSGDAEVGGGRVVVGRASILSGGEGSAAALTGIGEQAAVTVDTATEASEGGEGSAATLTGVGELAGAAAGQGIASAAAVGGSGVNPGDLLWLPAVISPVSLFLLMGVRRRIRG